MFAVIALVLMLLPACAWADPGTVSSDYNLFHPTPDDQMRSFSTDRPTKSNSPFTLDPGHIQYEADIANWTYDQANANHITSSFWVVGDPVIKLGLTGTTDLEMALSPLNFNDTHDRNVGTRNTVAGFGDIYTRLKWNLFGDDGGDYAFAVTPYVKAPTAAHNVGNGHWEGGFYAPFQANLQNDWTVTVQTELDFLENVALNGTHANYQNLINFGHPLWSDQLTGYVEFWSDVNTDANAQNQYTLDFASAWQLSASAQLDAGVNLGLNRAASDYQPYLGLSQRF